ncbi:hypothetical protein [Halorhabdus amylolytica]|uniref:hypothetical protein n=1 Tax=Halorhabdus amylolytica TaxID=2559573 RepID=UPI0010AB3F0F|nr:hypothetical protein [Halorhabdus amylolytica]
MYSLAQIRRGLSNPALFLREANRLFHRRLYFHTYNRSGIDIFDEDWDNLILLDGCRYDMLEERYKKLPGELGYRYSRGSTTVEFLRGNMSNRKLTDTVYITANPQLYMNKENINVEFHRVIDVWKEDGWDEEVGTVFPETVADWALDAYERFPNKRLLIHFIQPHYPFIESSMKEDKGHLDKAHLDDADQGLSLWSKKMLGNTEITKEEIWEAYTENLERAFPSVKKLMSELNGRTVVTSDHGNMVGEPSYPIPIRDWGHPAGIYTEKLTKVPWHIYEKNPRREIITGESKREEQKVPEETVENRLEDLGYVS